MSVEINEILKTIDLICKSLDKLKIDILQLYDNTNQNNNDTTYDLIELDKTIWEKYKDEYMLLKRSLSEMEFKTWFQVISNIEIKENTIYITAPSYTHKGLSKMFKSLITKIFCVSELILNT